MHGEHTEGQYVTQSAITEAGSAGIALLKGLPSEPIELRTLPLNVSIHYRRAERLGVDPSGRSDEPRMRQVSRMLSRIGELDAAPLSERRSPERRIIGHCRTSAVLLTTLLRHAGFDARVRTGFAAYWVQNMKTDHWIAEYWSRTQERWIMLDADLDDYWCREWNIAFDPNDVPLDRFYNAGRAWLMLRSGEADPESFGQDPASYGIDYVRGQLLRDLAALNKLEVGPWDRWGLGVEMHQPNDRELELLDQLAELSSSGAELDVDEMVSLYAGDPAVRAPEIIADDGLEAAQYMQDIPDVWREG